MNDTPIEGDSSHDKDMLVVYRELRRILGESLTSEDARFVLLPLATPAAAARFLATLPKGTRVEELQGLLDEYVESLSRPGRQEPFAW